MPAKASRMLIRDEVSVMIKSIWEEKMKYASKVTPIKYAVSSSRGSRNNIFNI